MSDKEAKLAAARKRAEALKAKKAKKNEADKAEDGESTTTPDNGAPAAADNNDEPDTHDSVGKTEDSVSLQNEIDRLQRLLDESTSQQEDLHKNLQEAQKQTKELEKSLKARITDLEGSLSRREDHAQTLELDLANLQREKEDMMVELRTAQTEREDKEKQLSAASSMPDLQIEVDDLRRQLDEANAARKTTAESLETLEKESSTANDKIKDLEMRLEEALSQQASAAGAVSPRETELSNKANALLSENQNLLSQLSELRTHLISKQDEKFALVESIERLQKELKEVKASKSMHKTSSDVPRARISRDFERTAAMQDVSLDEKMPAMQRNPAEPPAELRSNIQIDLTSWYDKHAGEVIEV